MEENVYSPRTEKNIQEYWLLHLLCRCSSTLYVYTIRNSKTNSRGTYCIDGGQREGEVEVVAVVDVSVPHELEILVSHHLYKTKWGNQMSLDVAAYNKWDKC